MAIKFTDVGQETQGHGVKIMVYAQAGAGKTVLSATLPRPVLISAESGLLSLRKPNLERLFGVGNEMITYNMPVIRVESYEDLEQAYLWCTQSAEAKGFDSVGLDSITEIAEQVLNHAKRTAKDPRQAYGEVTEKLETLVRSYRDMPNKHVYMAAKMGELKDEMSGMMKYGVMMPGQKLGQNMPYFMDETLALRIGKGEDGNTFRYLQTQPDLQYTAKDRSGALAASEFPHLGSIIQKILADGVAH